MNVFVSFLKNRAEDFMRRYMWPNSCLPSATALVTAAQTASQGRFTLEGVENHAARKSSLLVIIKNLHPLLITCFLPNLPFYLIALIVCSSMRCCFFPSLNLPPGPRPCMRTKYSKTHSCSHARTRTMHRAHAKL